MGTFYQDVRYAFRMLHKSPGFTLVVILTLALGIGANTAIFSIVDAVLLRPLPFHDAGQLVRVVDDARGVGQRDIGMSVLELQDLSQRSGVFDQISAVWPIDANLTGGDRPQRTETLVVGTNYFSLLGAKAQLGRLLGPEDDAAGFAEGVVISDSLWKKAFGGDPHVLGRKIRSDDDVYTIVGVLPPDFRHPGRTLAGDVEIWSVAGFAANPFPPPNRARRMLPGAIARLKPGVSLQESQARLDAFTAALRREFPNDYRENAKWTVQLEPLQDAVVGQVRPLLWVLLGAVTMMLLTGCVNIANLLLARASGRQREVAIRQAMGAMRGRLIRQLLTESVILSLIAGVVGVTAAAWTVKLSLTLIPTKIPRLHEVGLDFRVLLFALAVSLITGVLFGLAPALEASGISLVEHLKEAGRGSGRSKRQNRISSLLIVSEFAICMVLMMGAGLLVRSFWKLTQVDPGFNPNNVLAARIWLPRPNDPKADIYAKPEDRTTFTREVLRRVGSLPGVSSVAMTTNVPLSGLANSLPITVEDRNTQAGETALAEFVGVSPDYFKVLETPLLEGRYLAENDVPASMPVAILDRTTARRYWPNQSALGKRVRLGGPQSPWLTVVGVVGDIRHDGMDVDGIPHVYLSIYQRNGKSLGMVLRSPADPTVLGTEITRQIQSVDPNMPVFGVRSMSDMIAGSLAQRRFSAQLMGAFAALALLLAAIGIYGVLAYSIGQRTREIGIRMALGAQRTEVIKMVLWQGMRLIFAGVAVGILAAVALSQVLSRLLHGVSATDPVVYTVVPLSLLVVAFLASYIPAHKATRIDPMIALRYD